MEWSESEGARRVNSEFEYGRGAKERKEGVERERGREGAWHPKDGKPENGETIQSAADAANCPLIIRSRGDGRIEEGGDRGWLVPPSRFRRTKGRWMKYSSLIRCNCDVVLENFPAILLLFSFQRTHTRARFFSHSPFPRMCALASLSLSLSLSLLESRFISTNRVGMNFSSGVSLFSWFWGCGKNSDGVGGWYKIGERG